MTMTPDLLAYLRTCPGRCHDCGCHLKLQRHADNCPRRGKR